VRLTTAGYQVGFSSPTVGEVSTSSSPDVLGARAVKVFVGSLGGEADNFKGYRALISTDGAEAAQRLFALTGIPIIHSVRHIDHFRPGDVVSINAADGFIRTVYRPDSQHNTLFMTERCNSNCLMCSQPPKDVDDAEHFYFINREIIKFISPSTSYLTVTGGEPTLLGGRLVELLNELKNRLPNTHIHMLTNGRTFAFGSFAQAIASISHPMLSLGIPLYSDYAQDHDHIVQAKGAFDQTVLGLHQLARWHVCTEIRIVLHKLSIPRLANLAEYITRNLPFVSHVALMGLEPTGYTPRNKAQLWIDPTDYQDELQRAVDTLVFGNLNVSIYNTQLCLLRRELWPYAKRSISDWKNIYIKECVKCGNLAQCGGLFQSAERMHSPHIRAFA
jgi:His-Xaa-Ser system radical SAM maturase HxsC